MKFNLTYIVAGVEVIFSVVGMAFGWITGAEGSALILAGIAVFGARAATVPVANQIGKVGGIW
jgi:hypothetical protein